MGWTIIEHNDQHSVFKDFDVWTVRHFLLEESRALNSSNHDVADLVAFFERWDWLGPGVVVGTRLQDYVQNSASRKEILLSLFASTIERLRRFGGSIPLAYLAEHVNEQGRGYTKDQAVEPFIDVLQKMYDMLKRSS